MYASAFVYIHLHSEFACSPSGLIRVLRLPLTVQRHAGKTNQRHEIVHGRDTCVMNDRLMCVTQKCKHMTLVNK